MPITVDLEKIPLMRAAIERVRAKAEREIDLDLSSMPPASRPALDPEKVGATFYRREDLYNRSR